MATTSVQESKWKHSLLSTRLGLAYCHFYVILLGKTSHVTESRIKAWEIDSTFGGRGCKVTKHRVWKEGWRIKVINANLSWLSFFLLICGSSLFKIHFDILYIDVLSEVVCFWNKILKPIQLPHCTDRETEAQRWEGTSLGSHQSNIPCPSPFLTFKIPTWPCWPQQLRWFMKMAVSTYSKINSHKGSLDLQFYLQVNWAISVKEWEEERQPHPRPWVSFVLRGISK